MWLFLNVLVLYWIIRDYLKKLCRGCFNTPNIPLVTTLGPPNRTEVLGGLWPIWPILQRGPLLGAGAGTCQQSDVCGPSIADNRRAHATHCTGDGGCRVRVSRTNFRTSRGVTRPRNDRKRFGRWCGRRWSSSPSDCLAISTTRPGLALSSRVVLRSTTSLMLSTSQFLVIKLELGGYIRLCRVFR